MSDPNAAPIPSDNPVEPPAEAQKTVPYDRFSEVNEAKKRAEQELEKYRQAEQERKQKELEEQGKLAEVVNLLKPKADRADVLEATLKSYLDAEVASIPDDKRALIPEGDITSQLNWIAQAKALGVFSPAVPKAPGLDAGAQGDKKPAPPTQAAQNAAQLANQYGYQLDAAKIAERQRQIEKQRTRPNSLTGTAEE